MNKKKIRCELTGSDLYLYGPINPMAWEEYDEKITAKEVREALGKVPGDKLTVHLNSPGGDAFEANAIANLLKSSKKHITIIVEGVAASGATAILCSGDENIAYKNAMFLIHGASTFIYGNAKELRSAADELDIVDKAQLENYRARWKGTDDELNEQLEKGTFFSADEALKFGLIDKIIDQEKTAENEIESESNEEVVSAEAKAPDRSVFENLCKAWKEI